jgi:hypothetical protein
VPINDEHIALMDLRRGQQSSDWVNHMPLNGSLQVARSVPLVGSFLQQELPALLGNAK